MAQSKLALVIFIPLLTKLAGAQAGISNAILFTPYSDTGCKTNNAPVTLFDEGNNKGSGCVAWPGGGPYVDAGSYFGAPGTPGNYSGHIYFFLNDLCMDSELGDTTGKVAYGDACTLVGGGISGNTIGAACWSPTDSPHNDCAGGGTARKRRAKVIDEAE